MSAARALRPATLVIVALVVPLLGGCSAALPEVARQLKTLTERLNPPRAEKPLDARHLDLAFKALAEGNYHRAETHLDYALTVNPDNPFALLNLGVVYQNTGQPERARAVYRRLIALQSGARAVSTTRLEYVGATVAEIARANLDRLDGKGAAASPAVPEGGDPMAAAARFAALARLRDAGLIAPDEYAARRRANLGALLPLTGPHPAAGLARPAPRVADIAARLRTIASFRDLGALTEAEYLGERTAILDALMPMPKVYVAPSGAPAPAAAPARALARLDRLRAEGLISGDESARERAALLGTPASAGPTAATEAMPPPSGDATAAPPPSGDATAAPPPSGETTVAPAATGAAADGPAPPGAATVEPPQAAVARSPKAAAEGSPEASAAAPSAEATAAPFADPAPTALGAIAPAAGGAGFGLHLASFRTPERAEHRWQTLKTAHAASLAGLAARVERVDLGPEKGVFFRLVAGPLADAATAESRCGALRREALYCRPVSF